MTDSELNDLIGELLQMSPTQRTATNGRWAAALDLGMKMWTDRHPGTRPPCFQYVNKDTPPCFKGKLTQIYKVKK
jgi:Uma2 family endonuclease